jgi:hypothetical protein
LHEERFGTLVQAAERRSGHVVVRIPQTKTYRGLRQQREVDIRHAMAGVVKFMRRVQHRNRGRCVRRIQWIRQQIVIEVAQVTTVAALQVVPLVLACTKPQYSVGIATPAKAVDGKIVEQDALMIEGMHRQGLIE